MELGLCKVLVIVDYIVEWNGSNINLTPKQEQSLQKFRFFFNDPLLDAMGEGNNISCDETTLQ
jgi:hypothetical protein